MQLEVVRETPDPEEEVCEAARNDYSPDWQGDMSFEEIMEPAKLDNDVLREVAQERGYDERMIQGRDDWPTELVTEAKKRTLIRHLLKHGHFGPFEHPKMCFRVKGVSRSLMAQITRHRHASFDIQSMRYVEFELEEGDRMQELFVEIPELDDPGIVGRNAEFDEKWDDATDEEILLERMDVYWKGMKHSMKAYEKLLSLGVAPENARMVLPIGTKVNMYFSLNLRQILHVADMRAAADAQWEVRDMTERMLEKAREWAPVTMEYYEEEMKNRKNRLAP